MKKTVAVAMFMAVFAVSAAWSQGTLQPDGVVDDDLVGNPGVAIARSNPAAAGAHALKLVGVASSAEVTPIIPNDLNTTEVHTADTSVAVDMPADPERTYWFLCTSAFVFSIQVPSASPMELTGDIRVRLDTVDGAFAAVFRFEGVKEFDPSNRRVIKTAAPQGCLAVDQTQLTALFVAQGLAEADALAKAQEILRSPAHLTVTYFARIRSVNTVNFSRPSLQVWSD